MKKLFPLLLLTASLFAEKAIVIPHADLPEYSLYGNTQQGLATPQLGSQNYEVWKTKWGVGASTPRHKHETDEIFIFLKGKGKVIIDDNETHFTAPCTIICPANAYHQFFNTGEEKTESIVVLGSKSTILDENETTMNLPWRR